MGKAGKCVILKSLQIRKCPCKSGLRADLHRHIRSLRIIICQDWEKFRFIRKLEKFARKLGKFVRELGNAWEILGKLEKGIKKGVIRK